MAGFTGNGWKLMETCGNIFKRKVYKCLEMDGNCWKLLDLAGNLMEMAGNDWNDRKWLNVV